MSPSTNGVTLKSFAELATIIEHLEPSRDNDGAAAEHDEYSDHTGDEQVLRPGESSAPTIAALLAQLADMSSGLETMARQDARAREQATVELAQYESLVAERDEARTRSRRSTPRAHDRGADSWSEPSPMNCAHVQLSMPPRRGLPS